MCECDYLPGHDEKSCPNKTPYSIHPCAIQTDGGCYGPNHADAERIVACVNACRGIPNEFLDVFITEALVHAKGFLFTNHPLDWVTAALEARK
jgi:hypothetical protein